MNKKIVFFLSVLLIFSLVACQPRPDADEKAPSLGKGEETNSPESNDEKTETPEPPQTSTEPGVLERGDGYVIYDSSVVGVESVVRFGEILLPSVGQTITYEPALELYSDEETGIRIVVHSASRADDAKILFYTNDTELQFESAIIMHMLMATGEVCTSLIYNHDERGNLIYSEDGTISYYTSIVVPNEDTYNYYRSELESLNGGPLNESKSYFVTIKQSANVPTP